MQFDSNAAWKQAAAAVSANREVLLALAGVFFLLPSLAFSLFFPQPEPTAGMDEKAMMAMVQDYYVSVLPVLIPIALVQAAGTLTLLTLFTDRTRPTVREAIRRGTMGTIIYFAAQLLLGIAVGIGGGALLAFGALTGSAAVIVVIGVAVALIVIYVMIKTSLAAPVIAVEHQRNPIKALQRSWRLTKGNSARLGLFYLLVIVVFLLIVTVVMALVGITLALVASAEVARVIAAVVSSAFGAVMTLYMVAILASAHRQLAGPSAEAIGRTFD